MHTRAAVLGLLAPFFALAAPAAVRAADEFRLPRLLEGDLDNGLHVVVCPRPSNGIVYVRLLVGAGRYDDVNGNGAGELLARSLAATWRAERPALPALAADVIDRGTVFSVTAAANQLPAVFEGLATLVVRVDLADPVVAEQKAALLRDLDADAKDASANALSVAFDVAAPGHPGRVSAAARGMALQAISEADAVSVRTQRYVPGNAVLVVAGDCDAGTVLRAARSALTAWPRGTLPEFAATHRPLPPGPVRFAPNEAKAAPWQNLTLAWRIASPHGTDAAVYDVLGSMLAEGPEARLPTLLPQATVVGFSRDDAAAVSGLFAVRCTVAAGAVESTIGTFTQVGVELGRSGPTAAELARAVSRVRMRAEVTADRLDALCMRLATDRLWRGDACALEADMRRLSTLTVEDVRAIAATALAANAVIVAVQPGDSAAAGHSR